MGTYTQKLNLLKPAEDDFYNVTTQQSENWQKIDDWAKKTEDGKLDKGDVSPNYDTAKKIEDIIEGQQATIDLFEQNKLNKGNLASTIQSGEDIFKALQSNTGIKFDENLLYLNDEGTKKVGFCYLDRLADGIFECIEETTTKVNDSTYFDNFSNKELSSKIMKLKGILIDSGYEKDSNGEKWYRKYSDGYIEQWGITKIMNSDTSIVISLSIPYASTNYTVVSSQFLKSKDISAVDNQAQIHNLTESSFNIHANNVGGVVGSMSFAWRASGY